MSGEATQARKLEHLRICFRYNVESGDTWLKHVRLIHQAFVELDYDKIDTSVDFLGKRLAAPIVVTGMTGGHRASLRINARIAQAVEELGLAMGVGSQRAAMERSELRYTYRVVREEAPTAPIIANIGISQIAEGYGVKEFEELVSMIDADAIAIHLNVGQELFQPEGDKRFRDVASRLAEILDRASKPVIVKETGSGISLETARRLREIGVKMFDVSGLGGTNWIKIELIRSREKGAELMSREAEEEFEAWGIPTAASIIEVRWAAPDALIIASGGIRTGIDIAKSIALGADLTGVALPALKEAVYGKERLCRFLLNRIYELKATMFLTNSASLRDLRASPVVLEGPLLSWVVQRGIDLSKYRHLKSMQT